MFLMDDCLALVSVRHDGRDCELVILQEKDSRLMFAVESSYFEQSAGPVISPYGNGTGVMPGTDEDGSEVAADVVADQHGGVWGEHPGHPVADWQYEIANGDTRSGYWDWVANRLASA